MLHVSKCPSFSNLIIFHCILYHVLRVCLSVGHLSSSPLRTLGTIVLWTRVHRNAFENLFSVMLSTYPEVEFPDYIVTLFLIFLRKHHAVFHSGCTILHFHQQNTNVPISLHNYQHLLFSVFLIVALTMDVSWYVIVIWNGICLTVDNSWYYLPFASLLGRMFIPVFTQF